LLSIDQLVGYQRAEFSNASHLKSWLLLLQFLVAVPAALSVFFEGDARATYYLALLGFILLLAWVGVDNRATAHRDVAEHARRATLIVAGLGHSLSPGTLLELREGFIVSAAAADRHSDPNYFASGQPQGPARLSEMVEESAFWTRHLLAGSAVFMTATFIGLVLVGLVAFGIALPHMQTDSLLIVARLFLVLLVFILSTDVYGSAVGYWAAARKVEEVRRRLIEAEARGYLVGDVLLAVSDYNSAVEAAPQSIPFIYSLRRDHLNRSWKAYQDARAAHEEPE
jgi:hypothetical protein